MSKEIVKFVPFNSCINPSFWLELNRVKLEEYKLNDEFKSITGQFNNCSSNDFPPIINFDYSSFRSETDYSQSTSLIHGKIKVFNTINEFNLYDKNKLLDQLGQEVWSEIKSGKALEEPENLIKFCLITFANLKSYVFHYWFSFPAITFPNKTYNLEKCSKFDEVFDQSKCEKFIQNFDSFEQKYQVFFAVDHENCQVLNLKNGLELFNNSNKRILFGFIDPNSASNFGGWPLRNFLALLSFHCKTSNKVVEVLSLRDRYKSGTRTLNNSLIFKVELIDLNNELVNTINTVGWERNEKNQLQPRVVDMSGSMNSEKLAESAVNLNLKLMKWRIATAINLDVVRNYKCLLLGSGTLGCNVARCLMGWGVETITFVDNSKISYSNPVRQSLFTFEDSIGGASKENQKALKAAENLKKIYPGINAKGVVLSIPMPGHFVSENMRAKIEDDVKTLEKLIDEHDCVFLLMDTRESRWLPTVIATSQKKLVINSALGFDSFLVMRHGVKSDDDLTQQPSMDSQEYAAKIPGNQLGCYFCNDIVAPGNSTLDRTLDQQCTVSRPGLSMVASALAVELMVTILQHPNKENVHSYSSSNEFETDSNGSCLGIIPHQIRGYLHSYSMILPASRSYEKCTACSKQVIEMYSKEGFDFLIKVFNDSAYLEDITGLTELKNALDQNESDFVTELSDSDNEFKVI